MKKIFVGILAVVLCLCLCACGDKQEYLDNIMDYEQRSCLNVNSIYSFSDFEEDTIKNPYGFAIKITVTDEYENILYYEMEVDIRDELKGTAGYDRLKKLESGHAIAKKINALKSHILTTVMVDEIYYLGKNLKMREGDSIELVENWFISDESFWYDIESSIVALYGIDGYRKLEPGEEYIIFGCKEDSEGVYKNKNIIISNEKGFPIEVDKSKPETYYESENSKQVIEDYLIKIEEAI